MFTYQIRGSRIRIRGSDPKIRIRGSGSASSDPRIRIRKIVPAVLISVPALISVPCAPKNHRKNKRPAPLIKGPESSGFDISYYFSPISTLDRRKLPNRKYFWGLAIPSPCPIQAFDKDLPIINIASVATLSLHYRPRSRSL